MFGAQHAATLPATTAPSLGAQARAFLGRREAGADRAELQRTLQELHADVFTQIDQEVRLLLLHAALQAFTCGDEGHC